MAVMSQSEKSAFVIDGKKVDAFIKNLKKETSITDYNFIINQAKQIESQIKKDVKKMDSKLPKYGKEINLSVEKLSEQNIDELLKYDCGNNAINTHIRKTRSDSETERAYLFIDKNNGNIIAFVSLRASALVLDSNDKRGIALCPAIEIATFAVDVEYQHMAMSDDETEGSLSSYILSYVISIINKINVEHCAVEYIVLYSLEDKVRFYEKNLFKQFGEYMVKSRDIYTKHCVPMYLYLTNYNKALKEASILKSKKTV